VAPAAAVAAAAAGAPGIAILSRLMRGGLTTHNPLRPDQFTALPCAEQLLFCLNEATNSCCPARLMVQAVTSSSGSPVVCADQLEGHRCRIWGSHHRLYCGKDPRWRRWHLGASLAAHLPALPDERWRADLAGRGACECLPRPGCSSGGASSGSGSGLCRFSTKPRNTQGLLMPPPFSCSDQSTVLL
jgi:hypothetical protein